MPSPWRRGMLAANVYIFARNNTSGFQLLKAPCEVLLYIFEDANGFNVTVERCTMNKRVFLHGKPAGGKILS
jgi:hypothetical protein